MKSDGSQSLVCTRLRDVLFVTINRPQARNALNAEVVGAIAQVARDAGSDTALRAIVLRGANGFFCAGGDVSDFKRRLDEVSAREDPVALRNRAFGAFMETVVSIPVPLVAVVEGAALGGGMGLACMSDIVLATAQARFSLTETSLGVVPAQIMPFVVGRIGAVRARRMGLSAERVEGQQAMQLGIVDALADGTDALEALLADWLTRIGRCAPNANRVMKTMAGEATEMARGVFLDQAAHAFSRCMQDEGRVGIAAFRAREPAPWCVEFSAADIRAVYVGQGTHGASA